MKTVLVIFLFLSVLGGGLKSISKVNEYAARAAEAYQKENYAEAITAYGYLLDDLEVKDDQLRLNLAHAYFKAGLLTDAQQHYRLLADHPSGHMRAIVHLQLGNIAASKQKYAQALSLYRTALVEDPANETARYNYELLKKYLLLHPEKAEQDKPEPEQQQPQEQTPPPTGEEQEPQPKQKPDDQGDAEEETETMQPDETGGKQDKSGTAPQPQPREKEEASGREPGKTKGQQPDNPFDPAQQNNQGSTENASADDNRARTTLETQRQIKISPQKARMLLDAMRDAELQYLQQLPKKAKGKRDNSKPDW